MKKLILLTTLLSFNALAIDKDKQLHFGVSAVIGAGSQLYFEDTTKSALACMGVGVAKELIDEHDYGGFDEKGLIADTIGCAVGISGVKFIQIYQDGDAVGLGVNLKY